MIALLLKRLQIRSHQHQNRKNYTTTTNRLKLLTHL